MTANKKFGKIKIVCSILYIIILLVYGLFLLQNFRARQVGKDLSFAGNVLYQLNDNKGCGAFVTPQVNYSIGDYVVYKAENAYNKGTIEDLTTSSNVEIAIVSHETSQAHVVTSNIKGVIQNIVPFLGAIYNFLKSTLGIVLIVVLPCVLFLIYQSVQLFKVIKRKEAEQLKREECENELPFSNLPVSLNRSEVSDRFATLKSSFVMPHQETPKIEAPKKELPKENSEQRFFELDDDDLDIDLEDITEDDYLDHLENLEDNDFDDMDDVLSEMKYKMEFQDTQQLSEKIESYIEQDSSDDLHKYGFETTLIEDGIEVNIDCSRTHELKIKLKNDGSLCIVTDNYQAEINTDL